MKKTTIADLKFDQGTVYLYKVVRFFPNPDCGLTLRQIEKRKIFTWVANLTV